MKIDRETSDKLQRLEQSSGVDWISIIREVGEDPSTFFDNGLWVNVDFSMSDMSRVKFNGATVEGCKFRNGDEDSNGIQFRDVNVPSETKDSMKTIAIVSGASIQSINQSVSSADDFIEAMKIINDELDRGGRVNVDTINRLWHKLDHAAGVDLINSLMARYEIEGNEDTIIAVAKAKKRFMNMNNSTKINGGRVRIDKRRRRRALKRIQEMVKKKR